MSTQRHGAQKTCMSAQAANGIGTTIDVARYRNVMVAIAFPALSNLTVKAQGSLLMAGDASLDFSSAASPTNLWDYVAMYDMNDPSSIVAGSTGVTASGASVKTFMVNTDGLRSLNFIMSGFVAGSATIKVFPIED